MFQELSQNLQYGFYGKTAVDYNICMKNQTSLFPQILIVQASAGSGKTYALAMHYLSLLMSPRIQPSARLREILAITFTNKAAFEMKDRILKSLKEIALNDFANDGVKKQILTSLNMPEGSARKIAAESIISIMRHYNFFQVDTIDSFINTILSACSYNLNLSSRFRIRKDNSDYLNYSLDALIDKAANNPEITEIFSDFLQQYLAIENKKGWFPKQDILSILKQLMDSANAYGSSFMQENIDTRKIFSLRQKVLEQIHELYKILPDGTHKRFRDKMESLAETETLSLDSISRFFYRQDFPIRKGYETGANILNLWNSIRTGLKKICEWEAFSILNPYIIIFNSALSLFQQAAQSDDILFLNELNRQASKLFKDDLVSIPELYYRLCARFKHYLLDEFQDTSRLQWNNLTPLIQEALATNGSLFYVGDKKQAIYRFRGGEVSLFGEATDVFPNLPTNLLTLNTNYRSLKKIVEFNNLIFSSENIERLLSDSEITINSIQLEKNEIGQISKLFAGSCQKALPQNKGGYVNVVFLQSDNTGNNEIEQQTREQLMELINNLSHRFQHKDIAILTRTNSEIERVTGWLLEQNMPVESERTLNIRKNSYVQQLISLLKFLNCPIDNLSFASFILGDIFQKASGIQEEYIHRFLFDVKEGSQNNVNYRNDSKNDYYYKAFQNKFPEAWNGLLSKFFTRVGATPHYELLVNILNTFNVMVNFPEHQGFFMKLLELVKEQEEDYASLPAFLDYFEQADEKDLFVHTAETDAVKALTIHTAKGLQFPVVIIPFFAINVKIPNTICNPAPGGESLRLIRMKQVYANLSPKLAGIRRQEYMYSISDELNNAYVSFTRAQKELHIFIPEKIGKNKNLLARSFVSEGEYGFPAEDRKTTGVQAKPVRIPVSEYADWTPLLREEFPDKSTLENRSRITTGNVFHFALSNIGNLHNKTPETVIEKAISGTRMHFPFVNDSLLAQCRETIQAIIKKPQLQKLFFIEKGQVYTEKEIVNPNGLTKRVDRLVILPDKTIVADYKMSRENTGQHQKQIKEYMNILTNVLTKTKITGLIVYLDTLDCEEVNG